MADIDDLQRIYLFRTGVQVNSKDKSSIPAMGERGIMVVGDLTLYTVERRGGYVTLPKGIFECTMEDHKRLGKVLRVKAEGVNGHSIKNNRGILAGILVHAGNYPHHVVGCVAPGMTYIENGVGQSSAAMQYIFQFCGGWGVGKKLSLEVDSL